VIWGITFSWGRELVTTTLLLAIALAAQAQTKVSDFAWLAGRWTGSIPAGKVEESWSGPESGLMMGMFRLYTPESTLVLEYMSIRQTASGVEMRVRHFTPELKVLEEDEAITLRYAGLTGDMYFFENPVNGVPKTMTIRRDGENRLFGRSEIVRDDGSKSVIEVALRRDPASRETVRAEVRNTSYVSPSGERVLQHEAVVKATLEEAWKTVSTSEGLRTWVAPTAELELKTGGKWHTNYTVGSKIGDPGTIYNQVLSYVPMRMIAIKIGLTDQFPAALRQAGTLVATLQLEDLGGNRVKLTESMVGWQQGPEWDKTYTFFDRGNAYTMKKLQERFETGPVQWTK
jgi:hypothetical protein